VTPGHALRFMKSSALYPDGEETVAVGGVIVDGEKRGTGLPLA